MDLEKALKEAKDKSKKRKFSQTIDLVINIRSVDFNKVENRLNLELMLPHGLGKNIKGVVIADDDLLAEAKKCADKVITKDDLNRMAGDKKAQKKLAGEYKFFVAQASLMPLVGKVLGQALGPRNKMPRPVPGNAKLEQLLERMKKTIRIKSRGKYLPTIHVPVGAEDMEDAQLVENIKTVISAVKEKMPNKEGNFRSIYLKTSMGPAVKVEM